MGIIGLAASKVAAAVAHVKALLAAGRPVPVEPRGTTLVDMSVTVIQNSQGFAKFQPAWQVTRVKEELDELLSHPSTGETMVVCFDADSPVRTPRGVR